MEVLDGGSSLSLGMPRIHIRITYHELRLILSSTVGALSGVLIMPLYECVAMADLRCLGAATRLWLCFILFMCGYLTGRAGCWLSPWRWSCPLRVRVVRRDGAWPLLMVRCLLRCPYVVSWLICAPRFTLLILFLLTVMVTLLCVMKMHAFGARVFILVFGLYQNVS